MEEFIWTLKGGRADKLECAIRGWEHSGDVRIW